MLTIGILAGGLGTRISEETHDKPKPMVEINGKPILAHLINSLMLKGANKFYIAAGFKGSVISSWVEREGFADVVKVLDTGKDSLTGSRVRQLLEHVNEDRMLVTYGDGLANVNLDELISFHNHHGKMATVTAVHPPARFGHISLKGSLVTSFNEKRQSDEGWINGGYFILERRVTNFISDLSLPFEVETLPRLAKIQELMAYRHEGFWKPMDTLRDKLELEELGKQEIIPWLI